MYTGWTTRVYMGQGEYFVFYDRAEDSDADPVDIVRV